MANYEKAVAIWQQKNITTDAELAEALNGQDFAPLRDFLKAQTEKTWDKQIARMEKKWGK